MRELLAEVFASMRSNKMRITLTGFSIGWGMFILIILVGTGNGFQAGMKSNFAPSMQNIVTLTPGETSIAASGFKQGRPVRLSINDVPLFSDPNNARIFPYVSGVFPGYSSELRVSRGIQYCTIPVDGVSPGWEVAKNMQLTSGRDINSFDLDSLRKTVILSEDMVAILFEDDENPVGQYVTIGGIPFLVVGTAVPDLSVTLVRSAYIPISTAMLLYQPDGSLSSINIKTRNLDTKEKNESFITAVREMLAEEKMFSREDKKAVGIYNPYELFVQLSSLMSAIRTFIWIIGIATLIAGVVGISNIMLITVNERTRELGVRLAMGASSFSIISLVLTESIIITMIFGYVGVMIGTGLTQITDSILKMTGDSRIFGSPVVDFTTVIVSNLIMVVSGLIAGYAPAKRAVRIKLVEALTS